ncbi:Hypothetical protein, putative [Bodo saltans]|uniref:Uncharacterized protein n=1 Tax=Bodo saltans TaxID=75058 RepID=A0A0S4IRM8_BODSA|nr:Hypothetical protein, putative [Bodo saltans]|eukprot:CUF46636.1 Hypothetical protein, putative [Bodo saltans]
MGRASIFRTTNAQTFSMGSSQGIGGGGASINCTATRRFSNASSSLSTCERAPSCLNKRPGCHSLKKTNLRHPTPTTPHMCHGGPALRNHSRWVFPVRAPATNNCFVAVKQLFVALHRCRQNATRFSFSSMRKGGLSPSPRRKATRFSSESST